ncbi:MAG: cytochrome ubiquinol oxidase subunit I [Candidatus Dormibacteria bacterium]
MNPVLAASPAPVGGSLVGNSLLVAVVAILHIQIAAFLTGSTTLAAFSEGLSIFRGDERHERMAHGIVRSWAYVFSFGSALAIFFVVFVLTTVWGRFYVALTQITFAVFFFEALAFVAEVALLYALYVNWDRLRPYRGLRLGMLVILNVVDWWQMVLINVVASYMLSPNGGDRSDVRQLLNPTQLPLTVHRTVGNIAWAGALIAAFAGFRYLRARRREEAEAMRFWDWVGQWGVLWAVGMTLFQPYIGYSYAKEVQLHSYDSWYTMMFGSLSNVFELQFLLLGVIFILGALYFGQRLRTSGVPGSGRQRLLAVLLMATTLFGVQPAWFATDYAATVAAGLNRPWWNGGLLNPLGNFIPYKVVALLLLVVLGTWSLVSFVRRRSPPGERWRDGGRRGQAYLIALGVTVSVMMSVMGVIREHSRTPYLIHGELTISHQGPAAAPSPNMPQPRI